MKDMRRFFAATVVFCAVSTSAWAADCDKKVEAYAHPSLFGEQTQTLVDGDSTYQIGGKILKSKNKLGVKNKDCVFIDSWAKDLLKLIKEKGYSQSIFNPAMPILRSELAVVLSEGLSLSESKNTDSYSDIQPGYWANPWIKKATSAGVMIGYPSGVFKPDQPVTKAEVFATIAKQIDVKYVGGTTAPMYKNKTVQNIPTWAYDATKEVVNSGLLDSVPNSKKILEDEYLSKEQVAYLVGALKKNFSYSNTLASGLAKSKSVSCLKIRMLDRLSAKHSNIGDAFTAKTTSEVTVDGQVFPVDSIVRGEVIEVKRPGLNNPGFIKVKFNKIKNEKCEAELPTHVADANADTLKNPNIVARLLGAPFTGAGRVAGVAGRTAAASMNVAANSIEEIGDEFGNTFVETLTGHPGRGMASLGSTVVTAGQGMFDFAKLIVSGTFGVIYEITDEIVYVIVPSKSNSSSLNPNEELTILF